MKKQLKLFTAALLLALAVTAAFAQKPVRVKFGKNSTATLTGRLSGYRDSKTFLVRLHRGQTLRIDQLKSANSLRYVSVWVKGPKGTEQVDDADASCNSRKEISAPATGEYRITVEECKKADPWRGDFRLRVSAR